jgi:hypothetical protein
MRVLIDECLPRRLKNHLSDHDCRTFPEAGLAGKRTGGSFFLSPTSRNMRFFLTTDKGVQYQQDLRGLSLAVIIPHAKSNRLADLLPHLSDCLEQMKSIKPGQALRVGLR